MAVLIRFRGGIPWAVGRFRDGISGSGDSVSERDFGMPDLFPGLFRVLLAEGEGDRRPDRKWRWRWMSGAGASGCRNGRSGPYVCNLN